MPQLMFDAVGARSQLSWSYSVDPLKPHDPALFFAQIGGPKTVAGEHGLVSVPLNVVHEEVSALLVASWTAYLFGEPGDMRLAIRHAHEEWKGEAKARRAV